MGAYDITSQLYQDGLQRGLDRQFALATQAQPVTQFLAALRAKTEMDQKQQALDRQERREDDWSRSQNALRLHQMMRDINEGLLPTKESNDAARASIVAAGGSPDMVPLPRTVTKQGESFGITAPTSSFESIIKRHTMPSLTEQEAADENAAAAAPATDVDLTFKPTSVTVPGMLSTEQQFPAGAKYQIEHEKRQAQEIRVQMRNKLDQYKADTQRMRTEAQNITDETKRKELESKVAYREVLAAEHQQKIDSGYWENAADAQTARAAMDRALGYQAYTTGGLRIAQTADTANNTRNHDMPDSVKIPYQEGARDARAHEAAEARVAAGGSAAVKSWKEIIAPEPPTTAKPKVTLNPGKGTAKVTPAPAAEGGPKVGDATRKADGSYNTEYGIVTVKDGKVTEVK